MESKKDKFFEKLFLVAAIYDFALGILFFFLYRFIFNFFNITIPDYPAYLQMSAAFVIAMGVGYYFVYKNLYRNIDLVKLGVVYKFAYSSVAIYFYFTNIANLVFLWFAVFDIIFMIFFIWFLVYAATKTDRRYLTWK
ncbi:MAG: hypothetical protein AABX54_00010 [Nanoarchaeota archaeon]